MNAAPRLDEDYHVHSTFSDDAVSTLAENLAAARERGLRTLCLAEHVRRGTAWVPEFLAAVHALRPVPGLEVLAGVEVKILDRAGRLDLPGGTGGADLVLIADHQFPSDLGPVHPREMGRAIANGEVTEAEVIEILGKPTSTETQDTPGGKGSKEVWTDGNKTIMVGIFDGKVMLADKSGF